MPDASGPRADRADWAMHQSPRAADREKACHALATKIEGSARAAGPSRPFVRSADLFSLTLLYRPSPFFPVSIRSPRPTATLSPNQARTPAGPLQPHFTYLHTNNMKVLVLFAALAAGLVAAASPAPPQDDCSGVSSRQMKLPPPPNTLHPVQGEHPILITLGVGTQVSKKTKLTRPSCLASV
jgi:hypothetical protein